MDADQSLPRFWFRGFRKEFICVYPRSSAAENIMSKASLRLALLAAATLLAACAILPPEEVPVSDNAAVLALVAEADAAREAGRHVAAAAALERALRIESRNPRLWLELARVRLAQGDSVQAENLVARGLSHAGKDRRLRALGWRLIAEARAARGDEAGAAEADTRRRKYDRERGVDEPFR
jgi:predicted Zn-dependent protease